MPRTRALDSSIYSALSSDPMLADLVAEFAASMPVRVARLRRLLADQDWASLRRTAHQLKGAAGSYGFEPISQVAARLEQEVSGDVTPRLVTDTVDELAALCQSVRTSSPPDGQ